MDRIRGRAALHDWERRLGRFQAIMRPPPDLRSLLGRIRLASSPGARDAIVVATSSTDPPSSEFDALVQATLSQYEGTVGRQVSELARRAGVERGAVEPASRARARASRLQLEWSMVKSGQRAIEEIASLVQATWGADAAAEMEVRLHALIWPRLFDVDRPVRVVDPLARPPVWEDCLAGPARTGLVRLHRDILAQVSLHLKAGEFPLPPHDADMDGSHDRFQLVSVGHGAAVSRALHSTQGGGSTTCGIASQRGAARPASCAVIRGPTAVSVFDVAGRCIGLVCGSAASGQRRVRLFCLLLLAASLSRAAWAQAAVASGASADLAGRFTREMKDAAVGMPQRIEVRTEEEVRWTVEGAPEAGEQPRDSRCCSSRCCIHQTDGEF